MINGTKKDTLWIKIWILMTPSLRMILETSLPKAGINEQDCPRVILLLLLKKFPGKTG